MSFNINVILKHSEIVRIQNWQSRNEGARIADQKALNGRLDDLEANQHQLMETLSMLDLINAVMIRA